MVSEEVNYFNRRRTIMRGESIEDKVKKFQNAFGQSTNETYPSNHACSPTKTLRRTLIDEEYMELEAW